MLNYIGSEDVGAIEVDDIGLFWCVLYTAWHEPFTELRLASVIPSDVTTNEVERMVNNISGILLDVRNPNELEETGRIGHAINVPRKCVFGRRHN